jgi:hypothetical protein
VEEISIGFVLSLMRDVSLRPTQSDRQPSVIDQKPVD